MSGRTSSPLRKNQSPNLLSKVLTMHLKYRFKFQQYGRQYMAIADYPGDAKEMKLLWVNETGKEIMQYLETDRRPDDLIAAMREKYAGDDEEIRRSVEAFVAELDGAGFLSDRTDS